MRGTVEYLAGADLWSSQKDIQETHTIHDSPALVNNVQYTQKNYI
jgi:hypothetical protein